MDDRSKIMKMEYKAQQKKAHLLTADQAASLLQYVEPVCSIIPASTITASLRNGWNSMWTS